MKKARMYLSILSGLLVSLCSYGNSFSANVPLATENPITALDGSAWEQVNIPGFGNNNNFSVVAMAEYQGILYALTRNQTQGCEVWRTTSTGGWEQVAFPNGIMNGIYGNPNINNVWARMVVFNGKLYFGFSSGLQGNYLGSTGCEIWRYDGTTWEPVISDKRAVDETGTITSISTNTCLPAGGADTLPSAYFNNTGKAWITNQWAGGVLTITSGPGKYRKFRITANTATRLTVQQNEVAGTYTNGSTESEYTVCAEQTYNNPFPAYSYILGAVSAGDTYEINIGWDQNGFGNMWNKTITAMVVFNAKLYVSTGLNYEHGGQIWYTEDGDTWQATSSIKTTTTPYTYFSFGNFHTSQVGYPGSRKPVSSSVTDLVVSSVSGTPVLYAGGTGTSGPAGGCARVARLTETGWQLIVDNSVDSNTTGTNENGFGSPSTCGTNQYNFMPWSFADFYDELLVGISGAGARVLRAPNQLLDSQNIIKDMKDDGVWFYSVGEANVDPANPSYTDPLGTSSYPNGFDGYTYSDGNYQNLAVNLFPFGKTLYGGIITQYIPEYNIPANMEEFLGAQIWKSPNGMTWTQVTADGFGDSNTIMFEAFTVFDGTLYVSGSKGASSTPSGLGGAKIYRLASEPCVTVTPDQALVEKFQRYTVTGITSPLPGDDPNPPGLLAASFLRAGDLNGDGKQEIVVTSTLGESLDFYIKDGAVAVFTRGQDLGSWTQSIIRNDFAFANDVRIRDVDGDGYTDIMVFDNFLGGAFTNYPAGIYYLKNMGGDITDPANWEKITIFEGDINTTDLYAKAKARSSYHQAYFLDLDGDGLEDFATTRISLEIWQARPGEPVPVVNPCGDACFGQQYMWAEWYKRETDLVTYPVGFSGPYDIGEGAGFLMDMHDIDGDGLLDFLAPQFLIGIPGTLIVQGPGEIRGDSLAWFKNPGPAALAANPNLSWQRYTIDNWYTSSNPMGKGFMVFPADITNDGREELVFTSHNHQQYRNGLRVWPSGIYYLTIPDDPEVTENWMPVTIDAGDVFKADRPGGPFSQGSPGNAAVGDITKDGRADIVVAGDGRGALYYYEAVDAEADRCSLKFKRAALWDDPASMSAEIKLYDIDGDGNLEILATVFDTSKAKDSSSGSVFIWKLIQEEPPGYCGDGTIQTELDEQCELNSDCPEGYECKLCQCQEKTLITLSSFEAFPGSGKVTLQWDTASENDNAGFNIYRAEAVDGPYVKINDGLIPAKGSATQGASYKYVDDGVKNRTAYYYKLEDIDRSGTCTMHGPKEATPRFIYIFDAK